MSISVEPVFSNTPGSLTNVMIEDAGQYATDLFRKNLLSFMESSITLLIGILVLVIGLTYAILIIQ